MLTDNKYKEKVKIARRFNGGILIIESISLSLHLSVCGSSRYEMRDLLKDLYSRRAWT